MWYPSPGSFCGVPDAVKGTIGIPMTNDDNDNDNNFYLAILFFGFIGATIVAFVWMNV